MTVEFKNNNCFDEAKEILFKEGKKTLKIFYGSNGDLYIDIFGDHNIDKNGYYTATFSINQNQDTYQFFKNLIENIISCNVFNVSDIELELCHTESQIKKLLNARQVYNKELKNSSAYNKLVQDSIIIWCSDEIYDEKANKLQIENKNNQILLTFISNPDDPTFGFGIRICNSSSKYDPFNLCFMQLFNQLQAWNKTFEQKKLILKKL